MPLSLYEATVPLFLAHLADLNGLLDKGEAYAAERKFEPEALLGARLFPDMWPFSRQVQATTNYPVRCTARLSGTDIPDMPTAAATFNDLRERVRFTVAFVEAADPAAISASEERDITFPAGDRQVTLSGRDYFLRFALPNFYFHYTTAYDILRHNGVPVGKADFVRGV